MVGVESGSGTAVAALTVAGCPLGTAAADVVAAVVAWPASPG